MPFATYYSTGHYLKERLRGQKKVESLASYPTAIKSESQDINPGRQTQFPDRSVPGMKKKYPKLIRFSQSQQEKLNTQM